MLTLSPKQAKIFKKRGEADEVLKKLGGDYKVMPVYSVL